MRLFSATHNGRLDRGASLWSAATRRRSHTGDLAPKMLRAARAKSRPPQSDAGSPQSKSWCLVPHAIALVIIGLVMAGNTRAQRPEIANLFDGKTLAGWKGSSEYWRVEDGA